MLYRKQFLTLIEIMIVVAILAFATGVIGYNIRKAVIAQRFNTETDLFVNSMRLAQDMMLILSKDVHIKVEPGKKGEGMQYSIEIEGGTPKGWEGVVKRSRRLMQSVHYINFQQLDPFPSEEGQIDLRFQSKGSMMSLGEVQLSSHQDPFTSVARRKAVCLKGYPHEIFNESVLKIPESGKVWTSCTKDDQSEDFLKQLTLETADEVLNDRPPKGIKNSADEKKQEAPKKSSANDQVP